MRNTWNSAVSGVAPHLARAAWLSHEYLRLRLHQFHEDVALGMGPTVEALASVVMLRREYVPLFGSLLKSNRDELLALADARTLDPARALALMQRVGSLVREHPLLKNDLEAALVAHAMH
ncbi:hypothetical protein JY651_45405 [Pyxidicoccus parkwayensis]|uniref:Uncharacterized protein n=1 Tax=Pyxidicoccus parkwayensis TaxID=2813578 RepID=A0ABX7NTT3_9BACT|nr:hypothetical protein [Pyxidicoccus parkwaysis]QSQ22289.1 hypothetical protein JY651_45405 [Pyxidicoccus parkwaysis]